MGKSEENAKKMASKKPNEGLKKTDDAGWYAAVSPYPCLSLNSLAYFATLR